MKTFIAIESKTLFIITLWNKREPVESMSSQNMEGRGSDSHFRIKAQNASQMNRLHLLFSLAMASLHGPGSDVNPMHTETFHFTSQNYFYIHQICLGQVKDEEPRSLAPQQKLHKHICLQNADRHF